MPGGMFCTQISSLVYILFYHKLLGAYDMHGCYNFVPVILVDNCAIFIASSRIGRQISDFRTKTGSSYPVGRKLVNRRNDIIKDLCCSAFVARMNLKIVIEHWPLFHDVLHHSVARSFAEHVTKFLLLCSISFLLLSPGIQTRFLEKGEPDYMTLLKPIGHVFEGLVDCWKDGWLNELTRLYPSENAQITADVLIFLLMTSFWSFL